MEQVADLLAETLDGRCWTVFEAARRSGEASDDAVESALRLFRFTRPYVEARLIPSGREDYAVSMIGEIASGYAMLGKAWALEEAADLPLPTRVTAEKLLRELGIDDWASDLGHPLGLLEHSTRDSEEAPKSESALPATEEEQNRAAVAFIECAEAYGTFLKLVKSEKGRTFLRERFQSASCGQMAFLRNWAIWIRDSLDEDLAPLVLALSYIARGSFVLAWDPAPQEEVFPTQLALQELVLSEPAIAWLSECGVEIPSWLL